MGERSRNNLDSEHFIPDSFARSEVTSGLSVYLAEECLARGARLTVLKRVTRDLRCVVLLAVVLLALRGWIRFFIN